MLYSDKLLPLGRGLNATSPFRDREDEEEDAVEVITSQQRKSVKAAGPG